ncbi:16S rRNA (uracil(1498)-N(3))-methyltransferase [Clostridium sp. BNL1100]|uniref:16S rRNA (uracil(1498)-N(3))-methyltransferase n=1 Tax=Clostridium sp. BNL1100 TaxID=755731 RepID=UPI00024A716C|nr:16S rRNA (uracil(1498)-N(3))-methyltransferase [Clostridium sp. BNL1100]AEY66311.1 RNA methyltransferase, RsmE family [Clostridium sp. BNL1100]
MSRYFVEEAQIANGRINIIGEDFQHLKKVLRAQIKDEVTVCCGGFDYTAEIEKINDSSISCVITDVNKNFTESPLKVTLFQGLPKSDKMELIIQKCVELGVWEIVPVITERCVSRINTDKDAKNKLARWQKIAREAAKQCNRGTIPNILYPITFKEAVEMASQAELAVIPYEKESAVGLKNIVPRYEGITSGSIIIGPEGGFEEKEVQLAEDRGVKKISLGPRILRTETAGMVALSLLMYELGDVSNGRT